jgi:hypothetical protein
MANKVYDYYKDLPSWAKGIVVVGGVGFALLVGFQIYKRVFKSEESKKSADELKHLDSDINNSVNKGLKPSFSQSTYDSYANTIYDGMRYILGDSYSNVENTLKKMKNNLDVELLKKSFGKRQDYAVGFPVGDKMDLFTYVRKELGNDYAGLTDYRVVRINKDWASKGITYQI